jgi:DhnA family fructose-bisphosphate aldolase class Ia
MILVGWQNISRSREQLGCATGSTAALASIDRVAAIGAAGIMTYLFTGFEDPREEAREIEATVGLAEERERLGLVLLVESRAVRDERNQDGSFRLDPLKLRTRMAAEIGADLVKTKQPATMDGVRELTESCPCPILFAGARSGRTPRRPTRWLGMPSKAVLLDWLFGRNIYQQGGNPAVAVKMFSDIVHGRGRHDGRVSSE